MSSVRPTYSVGHAVSGLPSIRRLLQAAPLHELYELDEEPQRVLLLTRLGPELNGEKLERWLGSQDPRLVVRVQPVPERLVPIGRLAVVIQLAGRCLNRVDLADAREERLLRFFGAMLQVVERASGLGLSPDFAPGLVWEAEDIGALAALMPSGEPSGSEANLVHSLARSFYQWASGVDPNLISGSPSPLKSWSKFAGDGLSRVVTRCIAPATPRDAITSLAGLAMALARLGPDTVNSSLSRRIAPLVAARSGWQRLGKGGRNA